MNTISPITLIIICNSNKQYFKPLTYIHKIQFLSISRLKGFRFGYVKPFSINLSYPFSFVAVALNFT